MVLLRSARFTRYAVCYSAAPHARHNNFLRHHNVLFCVQVCRCATTKPIDPLIPSQFFTAAATLFTQTMFVTCPMSCSGAWLGWRLK